MNLTTPIIDGKKENNKKKCVAWFVFFVRTASYDIDINIFFIFFIFFIIVWLWDDKPHKYLRDQFKEKYKNLRKKL